MSFGSCRRTAAMTDFDDRVFAPEYVVRRDASPARRSNRSVTNELTMLIPFVVMLFFVFFAFSSLWMYDLYERTPAFLSAFGFTEPFLEPVEVRAGAIVSVVCGV